MKSIEVADRYAQAVYELGVEEGLLDEIQGDLEKVNRLVDSNELLLPFLVHPLIKDEDKRELLDEAFGDSLLRETLNFLKLLVTKDREDYLPLIYRRLRKIRRDEQEIVEVEISIAPGLDREETIEKVKERLEGIMDKSVFVTGVTEDEELIGGVKLRIGELVIDGSVRGELNGLREHILEGGDNGRN